MKSNVVGELVEGAVSWATKSFGLIGILAVLAIGVLFFKPIMSLFGGAKSEQATHVESSPNGNEQQIAAERSQQRTQNVDLRNTVRDNAAELAKLGYQVNAQGDVKNVNGQAVSPDAAINHLIAQNQAQQSRGTPA